MVVLEASRVSGGTLLGVTAENPLELPGALPGEVVRDDIRHFMAVDANGNPVFSGVLQDRVVREEATGTLAFYYRITELSAGRVARVWTPVPLGARAEAEYRLDGLGDVGPVNAERTEGGTQARFEFLTGREVTPNASSCFFFVRLGITGFDETGQIRLTSAHTLGSAEPTEASATIAPAFMPLL